MPSDSQPADENRHPSRSERRPRVLFALVVLAAVGLGGIAVTRAIDALTTTRRPPSVVLILVDTLRADYLGAYGFDGPVSPNLDAFAGESVLFERAFSQAPWTKPSIASLFTSLQPETHKVLSHEGKYGDAEHGSTEALPAEAATIAESFQAAGYATAAFVANPWMLREHGFAQGFDVYDQHEGGLPPTTEAMLRPVRRWLAARKPGEPFFLYLHLMDVHGPYDAPDADYEAVRDSPGLGPAHTLTAEEMSGLRRYLLRARWVNGDDVRELRTWRGRYAAGVHAVDRQLGPFLEEMKQSRVLDESIVVVTADHGEELCDNGGWDHGFRLWDNQIRVPLLVHLPGGAGAGRRVEDVVSLIDLMPTLLAQGGITPPDAAQGHDFSSLLEGGAGDGPGVSYAGGVKWSPELHSLRAPDWKLIRDGRAGPTQLFDLTTDPGEQHDVSQARPHELASLEGTLAAHQDALAVLPSLAPAQGEVSDEMKKRLEALGYAH